MAAIEEHVENIKAAIQAAREDGYLVDFEFDYDYYTYDYTYVDRVTVSLARNRRGEDGIMRQVECETFLEADI